MAKHLRWGPIALVLILVTGGCSAGDGTGRALADAQGDTATTSADTPIPRFVEGECPSPIPDADGFRCGTVSVPLRRDVDSSASIELAVAVLPAPEPGLHDDPAVVIHRLEPTLNAYEGHSSLPERIQRDVVLFDMRGTGRSTPSLECPEVDYRNVGTDTDPVVRGEYLDALDACRARLEGDGVDLAAFTIAAIADDVVDIRRALGYERWNVIGYGQREPNPGLASADIVYELMRRDGDAIRSVTMESPTPPQQNPWSTQIENLVRAIEETTAACAADGGCAAAHPTLPDDLAAGFRQPRTEYPATSGEGDPMTVVSDPAWAGFYDSTGLGQIEFLASFPALITLAPEGLADVIGASTKRFIPGFDGLSLSALCPQTGANTSPTERSTPNHFGAVSWGVFVERDSCERWTHAQGNADLDQPLTSDIPTLLLVGQFDPFNTTAGARLLASTLTNAYVYEVPAATANPLGHSDCARNIRNSFVQTPEHEPDTNCLSTVPPVQFAQ